MASCAASLTAPSLSLSSGSGCRRGLRGRERVREPRARGRGGGRAQGGSAHARDRGRCRGVRARRPALRRLPRAPEAGAEGARDPARREGGEGAADRMFRGSFAGVALSGGGRSRKKPEKHRGPYGKSGSRDRLCVRGITGIRRPRLIAIRLSLGFALSALRPPERAKSGPTLTTRTYSVRAGPKW